MSLASVKVLITGSTGQLGYALQQTQPAHLNQVPLNVIALERAQLDLSAPDNIPGVLDQHRPDLIINAAAYTAVDKAESESKLADKINHKAVAALALWCAQNEKKLLQVSTDFVFDGKKSTAYLPDDETRPLGVYGITKRAGELAALDLNPQSWVVRTGWVYSEHRANFVKTMLRLGAERASLGIVTDQIGTPTYAMHLAEMLWVLAARQPTQKILHFSDSGVASWFDFATEIFSIAHQNKILAQAPQLKPIRTCDYPTPAQRPSFSVLDKFATWESLDITPVHWRQALAHMLDKLIR